MSIPEETRLRLAEIPNLTVFVDAPLSRYTRFGIGGPADLYAETESAEAFIAALTAVRAGGAELVVIGGGTNLIVSDRGFRGVVLRYRGDRLLEANGRVHAGAGAVLQDLVDFAIARGLAGLETLAGIPGSVGAAVYGNAGAYGHSLSERVVGVRFYDGQSVRVFDNQECEFHYRESIFKRRKDWIVFSTELRLDTGDARALREAADSILKVRNEKFPVTMKCAGSIFKNLLVRELPEHAASQVPAAAIREGKVPAAWFLEQVGAKGMVRGDIHVATYHANLIYNAGAGTAADLCALIRELKHRVADRFAIELEEEVQYVGCFD
ncbi:MAG TPA: UDP-N-acetylmuramate dehydrogenase [Bryobacteraceae bacterium]|jgi:UDP-N-acetylmuramate dehydrogenase|nr:UDP-N-acetylmuramate dehydrogenase [Bryobacteraceae bacterium]